MKEILSMFDIRDAYDPKYKTPFISISDKLGLKKGQTVQFIHVWSKEKCYRYMIRYTIR